MAELGTTDDPKALIPGNPEVLLRETALCYRFSENLVTAGEGLKQLDTSQWKGEAADAFHNAFDGHPLDWIKAGDTFSAAADALASFAEMLEWAQGQATEAIALWNEAQAATARAESDHAHAVEREEQRAATGPPGSTATPIPFVDPGAEKRALARNGLHRARMQLVEAGDRAATAFDAATGHAPDKPGFWGQVGSTLSEFGAGIGEWAGDLGSILTNLDDIPANVAQAWAHPVEFAKGVVNWEQFHTNPARAVGHVLPDALLSLAGGVGAGKKVLGLLKKVPTRRKGCFVAGTTVLTKRGQVPIENVSVGEQVYSTDPRSGRQDWCVVEEWRTHEVPELVDLQVDAESIACSPEHPFWVAGFGWSRAGDLNDGDVLLEASGDQHTVRAASRRHGTFTVYNLEVAGLHTYHVSALSLLVHNKAMSTPEPEGVPKKRDEKWLKRQGIEPHEVKEDLPGPMSHFDLHVDKRGSIFAVRKGADPRSGEYIGNVLDYGD